jgi:hypothetical protein
MREVDTRKISEAARSGKIVLVTTIEEIGSTAISIKRVILQLQLMIRIPTTHSACREVDREEVTVEATEVVEVVIANMMIALRFLRVLVQVLRTREILQLRVATEVAIEEAVDAVDIVVTELRVQTHSGETKTLMAPRLKLKEALRKRDLRESTLKSAMVRKVEKDLTDLESSTSMITAKMR